MNWNIYNFDSQTYLERVTYKWKRLKKSIKIGTKSVPIQVKKHSKMFFEDQPLLQNIRHF
jgi:hypothetical protein